MDSPRGAGLIHTVILIGAIFLIAWMLNQAGYEPRGDTCDWTGSYAEGGTGWDCSPQIGS